jgi:predicted aminopeptidase
MNWFGGDPLLNTFINYPEGELARMMFHELSHQVLYVPDDTMFNESFATAVERLGVAQWLSRQASISARQEYAEFEARRRQFHSLTRSTRDKLRQIYTQIDPVAPVSQAQVAMKIEAMQTFRSQYAILKKSWGDYSGYDTWVAQANNASFGAQAAYDELVPGFETLFAQQGGDWLGFYDAVRQLAKRPAAERIQRLKQ